jgi:hypothetical protein
MSRSDHSQIGQSLIPDRLSRLGGGLALSATVTSLRLSNGVGKENRVAGAILLGCRELTQIGQHLSCYTNHLAASRQVVEEKTSACILGTGYAVAESSCLGASLVSSMTVIRLARMVSMLR